MIFAVLAAVPFAFLPAAWRERYRGLPLVEATGVGGVLQLFGFGFLWLAGLFAFMSGTGILFASPAKDATGSATAGGAVAWFLYLFTPHAIATGIGAIEGGVRLASAVAGEPCGSLLLWLAERGIRRLRAKPVRKGPPPPDEVTPLPEGGFRIATATKQDRWHELMTVEIDGAFFRVVSANELDAKSLRPFVYELAPVPASWTMRGLARYPS